MSERESEKIPARTERYAAVMAEAARRAQARDEATDEKPLVTISDVFEAVCLVHPEAFSQLLGCCVTLPEIKRIDCGECPDGICHSSEVDRYLSPYGGVIAKMLSSFMFSYGDEETDGVSDIAKRIDLAVQSGKGYVRITAGKDANVRVSTLNGMQMAKEQMYEGDTRTITLPSGIYIINGMKIIVK